jgi:hypothetical protein
MIGKPDDAHRDDKDRRNAEYGLEPGIQDQAPAGLAVAIRPGHLSIEERDPLG